MQTKRTKGEQKRKRCEELRRSKEKIEGNWKETLLRHARFFYLKVNSCQEAFIDQPKQVQYTETTVNTKIF